MVQARLIDGIAALVTKQHWKGALIGKKAQDRILMIVQLSSEDVLPLELPLSRNDISIFFMFTGNSLAQREILSVCQLVDSVPTISNKYFRSKVVFLRRN